MITPMMTGKAQSHRGETDFLLIIILLLALTLAGVSIRTLLVPSAASAQNGNIASQTQSGDQAPSPDLSPTGASVKARMVYPGGQEKRGASALP
jgi:hypothetical protein